VVSNMRKCAVQASRFIHVADHAAPLYAKQTENEGENGSTQSNETVDGSLQPSFECSDEGLGFTWFLGYLFLVRHLILRYGKRKTALFRYQNKEKLSSTDDHRELKNP